VSFRELSEIGNGVENESILIINTNVIIDGMVASLLRLSGKEPELSIQGSKGLLAADLALLDSKGKIFQEENIADGEGGRVVFNVLGKQEDSKLLVVEGGVDEFESHAVVSLDIFAIRVGGVSDDTEGGVGFVGAGFGLDFSECFD
jgi:hypothetical protein